MAVKLNDSLSVLKKVFRDWKYSLLALLLGFVFYIINFVIASYGNIISSVDNYGLYNGLKFVFTFFLGFGKTITQSSFVILIFISFLTGALLSLIVYKVKNIKEMKKTGFWGATGIFLGLFASGCASCGLGLIAVIGLSSALATLPLKGIEIAIFAVLLLLISIYKLSSQMFICKVNLFNDKNMKGGK